MRSRRPHGTEPEIGFMGEYDQHQKRICIRRGVHTRGATLSAECLSAECLNAAC